MCLSLIYLFDQKDLKNFFRNVQKILKPGGLLILDSAGSPDNNLSYLIHDILLKIETILKWLVKAIINKTRYGFVIKHHGYRRTDKEIIECAKQYGFELIDKQNYAFLTEFRRSYFFNRMIKSGSTVEKIFNSIGKNIPYIRMFCFRRVI